MKYFILTLLLASSNALAVSSNPCERMGQPENNSWNITFNVDHQKQDIFNALELMTAPGFKIDSTNRFISMEDGKSTVDTTRISVFFSYSGTKEEKESVLQSLSKLPDSDLSCNLRYAGNPFRDQADSNFDFNFLSGFQFGESQINTWHYEECQYR